MPFIAKPIQTANASTIGDIYLKPLLVLGRIVLGRIVGSAAVVTCLSLADPVQPAAALDLTATVLSNTELTAAEPATANPATANPATADTEPASTATPLLAQATSDRYLLGAGDILRLEIFNLPDYSRDYQVAADGYLALPLVGSVLAQDLTVEQLRATVTERYGQFIRQPILTFEIMEARPLQIAISGEVNRPGTYTVSMAEQEGANGMTPPTLTEALQLAEGITQSADIREVAVYRQNPANPSQPLVRVVNLWELLASGNIDADVALQDGDSIRVPTATVIDSAEATTLATATFSPAEMNVYVVGEVDSPGPVQVPASTPLNQALLAAGGFNERARTASVELVRLNDNGTVAQRDIEVDLAASVNEVNNPLLQQNDTIVVRRSGAAAFSDSASNFVSPFGLLINLFRALSGN